MKDKENKSLFPAIALTSLLTSIIVISILGVGLYLFFPRSSGEKIERTKTENGDHKIVEQTKNAPKKQKRKPSPISSSSITRVQYIEVETATDYSKNFQQFFGNVNSDNYLDKSKIIILSSDGTGSKTIKKSGRLDGKKRPQIYTSYRGSFSKEKFLELAKVLVENDFLGEGASKNTTSLLIKRELVISYSDTVVGLLGYEKRIELGHGGHRETLELEAMLNAFENLESQIRWVRSG